MEKCTCVVWCVCVCVCVVMCVCVCVYVAFLTRVNKRIQVCPQQKSIVCENPLFWVLSVVHTRKQVTCSTSLRSDVPLTYFNWFHFDFLERPAEKVPMISEPHSQRDSVVTHYKVHVQYFFWVCETIVTLSILSLRFTLVLLLALETMWCTCVID
jgi:hypothetical protein